MTGVRKTYQGELDSLVGYQMAEQALLDASTYDVLVRLTRTLHREILIMTDDKGRILHVGVGDASTAPLEDRYVQAGRRTLNRLRVIHTHPGGSPYLSEEDYSASSAYAVECMVALGVPDAGEGRIGIGVPVERQGRIEYALGICDKLEQLNAFPLERYIREANRFLKHQSAGEAIEDTTERALLIGVDTPQNRTGISLEDSMQELRQLVETAGGEVVEVITQNRPKEDPVFYVGRGKLLEIKRLIQNEKVNLIVTNDELSASQIACIEANTGIKTVDRTTIILDIFARQARTREGKLQVELAQQKYRLTHLRGMGLVLSRTGGGIGTRGPGEKKLETDRRHIRRQIDELERRIEKVSRTNRLNAARREKNSVKTASLIGYTNSGKSTLFNRLTDSDVIMKDALFVTLDSTMRKIDPDYGDYLLSDTVGFIEKLPHELVRAFRTTLKEVETADLLIHVVDASNPNCRSQMDVVDGVIQDMGVGRKGKLMVYNKMDRLSPEQRHYYENLALREENTVCISARTGENVNALTALISRLLKQDTQTMTWLIPYTDSRAMAMLHEKAEIRSIDYTEKGNLVVAEIPSDFPVHYYSQYRVLEEKERL